MDDVVHNRINQTQDLIRGSFRTVLVSMMCLGLAACGTTMSQKSASKHGKEYFPESKYGVKASPRVASGANIPKGGGRYMVGQPYRVAGKWYYPKEDFSYNKVGLASWYGSAFHGRKTANGEVYDEAHLSAAHPTFPLPSYARVTNLENGSSVIVRVNDRGPYDSNRLIDLSNKTAELLDVKTKGTARVRVQYVGRARMDGHDMPFLMASYVKKGSRAPAFNPGNNIATGVMVASNDTNFQPSSEPLQREGPVAAAPAAVPVPVFKPAPVLASNELPPPVTANALANEKPQAAAFDAALQEFAPLPVYGPIPAERPSGMQLAFADDELSPVAAYAESRVEDATYAPFDAILNPSKPLTPDAIVSSFHRRNGQK